jgi:hypothetical protein
VTQREVAWDQMPCAGVGVAPSGATWPPAPWVLRATGLRQAHGLVGKLAADGRRQAAGIQVGARAVGDGEPTRRPPHVGAKPTAGARLEGRSAAGPLDGWTAASTVGRGSARGRRG